MAKRIQYKFIYTSQRVAKPGRLQSIDARQFRTDHGYTMERDGDTVYVSRNGHTVEIPWFHIVSAVRVDDGPAKAKAAPKPKGAAAKPLGDVVVPGSPPPAAIKL